MFFHERRLQFMEREQLESWIVQRPGERILDIGKYPLICCLELCPHGDGLLTVIPFIDVIDSPLSYGILDYRIDPLQLNLIEFLWESTKECGIFIKVIIITWRQL